MLLHRFSDFADTAIDLYEKDRIIPAFVITRALIENTAVLYWLLIKIQEFETNRDILALDEFLMKGLMGGKIELTDVRSYNILTAVDHFDKKYTGTRNAYDRLSEFVHPNYSGVMGSYSKSEPDKFTTHFGKHLRMVPVEFGLIPLLVILEVFIDEYNNVGSAIKKVNDSFDSAQQ
jgi:hypothetical protein